MTYMTTNEAVNILFAIDKKLSKLRPDEEKLAWIDSGMYVPNDNATPSVLWRNWGYGYNDEHGGTEWEFSFSSDGDVEGDIDPAIREGVLEVLAGYQTLGK